MNWDHQPHAISHILTLSRSFKRTHLHSTTIRTIHYLPSNSLRNIAILRLSQLVPIIATIQHHLGYLFCTYNLFCRIIVLFLMVKALELLLFILFLEMVRSALMSGYSVYIPLCSWSQPFAFLQIWSRSLVLFALKQSSSMKFAPRVYLSRLKSTEVSCSIPKNLQSRLSPLPLKFISCWRLWLVCSVLPLFTLMFSYFLP